MLPSTITNILIFPAHNRSVFVTAFIARTVKGLRLHLNDAVVCTWKNKQFVAKSIEYATVKTLKESFYYFGKVREKNHGSIVLWNEFRNVN